jgi:excisionase family DNA binding protein
MATAPKLSAAATPAGRVDGTDATASIPRITLSVANAAAALDVSPSFLRTLIDDGTVPVIRIRGRVLVPVAGLADAMAALTGKGAA